MMETHDYWDKRFRGASTKKIIGAYLFVRLDEEIGKYSSWADLKNLNLSYSIESRLIESSSRLPAWYVYVEK
jgi:hypothetical protein